MTMTLEFRWTVSRGRETYGYNICTLWVNGTRAAACNGGGYDMKGTSLGNWVAMAYRARLLALRPEDMPAQSHWQRAEKPRRICVSNSCRVTEDKILADEDIYLPHDAEKCPHCGGETRVDWHDGKTIQDGRYFYGLTFHDPKFDPGKAIIGEGCTDRTLGKGAEGLTVAEAERKGESFGLERYQAFYSASSKVPTEKHVIPQIDGGCGFSCVQQIMKAIGLELEYVPTRGKNNEVYTLHDNYEAMKRKPIGQTRAMKHYA